MAQYKGFRGCYGHKPAVNVGSKQHTAPCNADVARLAARAFEIDAHLRSR